MLPSDSHFIRQKLLSSIGISNAKIAYEAFKNTFNSERFKQLLTKGANVQRPLWASTSTKNRDLSDVLYIDSLIGENTVNTVPDNTLKAFIDHGSPSIRLYDGVFQAEENIGLLEANGINLDKSLDQLLIEGIQSFTQSYDELILNIESKIKSLSH